MLGSDEEESRSVWFLLAFNNWVSVVFDAAVVCAGLYREQIVDMVTT